MSRSPMTVLYWTRLRERPDGSSFSEQTKQHVSIDGAATVCGYDVPPEAATVAITPDWHKFATCYNCVYRLWPDHAPAGYVRPVSGSDFPLRAECPHLPGRGRDPLACPDCTPPPAARRAAPDAVRRAAGRPARDPGNPAPDVIRRWHIPCPYDHERCALCGDKLARGELVNIEFEAGVMHAACSDPPPPDPPGPAAARAVGSDHPDPSASGDTVAVHDPFEGTEFIVLEFNPSTAGVSVLTTPRNGLPVTGYSDINATTRSRTPARPRTAPGRPACPCATPWSASLPRKSSPRTPDPGGSVTPRGPRSPPRRRHGNRPVT